MMPSLWKKLSITATVLLVISFALGGGLWYQLDTTKSQLDITKVQLDTTKTQLDTTTAQLNAIKPGMDSLKTERDQILTSYANLRRQINLRLGIRQDGQSFITPDDPEISAKVQEITGGYSDEELWRDYGRLFRWVNMNVEYSLDSPTPLLPKSVQGTLEWEEDFWRMPVETIRDGAGDCEDAALLLASMLLNYNQRRFPVWVVGAKTSGSKPRAHIAVAIPCEDNQLAIFDIAAHYYTSFPIMGSYASQDVPLAVDHWLTYLEEEMLGAQIYVVFSENFYQEFSGNQEFIDWASKPY